MKRKIGGGVNYEFRLLNWELLKLLRKLDEKNHTVGRENNFRTKINLQKN